MITCNTSRRPFFCPSKWQLWAQTMALLPRGRAWQSHEDVTPWDGETPDLDAMPVMQRYWAAYAELLEYLHQRACALINEFFCESIVETADDWHLDYGFPDDCAPYDTLCDKVRAQGGSTCAYLSTLAARLGYTIVCRDVVAGAAANCMTANCTPLCQPEASTIYIYIVTSLSPAATQPTNFAAGCLVANCTPPCNAVPEAVSCLVERYKPAHTAVKYVIVETMPEEPELPAYVPPAAFLYLGERQGMAMDFADMSLSVRHAATPANNYDGSLDPRLTYVSPSPKLVRNASGVLVSGTTLRTDHTPAGVPLGLRHEAAATNLILWSKAFDNAWWTKSNSTVTASLEIAPDGTTGAWRLEDANTTSATHNAQRSNLVSFTGGVVHTLSVYVKANARSAALLAFGPAAASGTRVFASFDLAAKTVSSSGVSGTGWTFSAAGIEDAGNGWFRVWLAGAATATTTGGFNITPNSALSYAGVVGSGIHIWQAQLEVGSAPSSPIVTAGAAVTRAADVITFPQAAFPWNGGAGSLFVDRAAASPVTSGADLVITKQPNTTHIRDILWLPA